MWGDPLLCLYTWVMYSENSPISNYGLDVVTWSDTRCGFLVALRHEMGRSYFRYFSPSLGFWWPRAASFTRSRALFAWLALSNAMPSVVVDESWRQALLAIHAVLFTLAETGELPHSSLN